MQHQPLPIEKVKLVIFDWDNTLAETRTPLTFAVNKILKDYGMPDWEEVKKLRDTNLSFRDNFPRIFGSKAEEAYKKYAAIYLQNVKNLISSFKGTQEVLNWLKAHGIRTLAATPHTDTIYTDVDMTGPIAIVVGTEQTGLTELWMDHSDLPVRIPMLGKIDSLNVATATTILLYEAARQRKWRNPAWR